MNAWYEAMWLWSWQSLLLAGVAAAALKVRQPAAAAARHFFWLIVVVAIACLPAANEVAARLPGGNVAIVPLPLPPRLIPISPTAIETAVVPDATPASEGPENPLWLASAVSIAFWIWSAFSLAFAFASFRSYLAARRLRAEANPKRTIPWAQSPVPLAYSPNARMPILVGILHPVILLPADIAEWTTSDEQRTVILHELAHYQRKDHLVNVLRLLLRSVLFFHPAVHYALRQLMVERELACDERVLQSGASSSVYAEAMLKVAERSVKQREILAPALNSSGKTLDRRLGMIRNYKPTLRRRSRLSSALRAAAVFSLAVLVIPQGAVTSPLRAEPAVPAEIAQAVPPSPIQVAVSTPQQTSPPASRLTGVVTEPQGRMVSGLEVVLSSDGPDKITMQTTVTNSRGVYEFSQLAPGPYTLSASLQGFAGFESPVTLKPGEQTLSFQIDRPQGFNAIAQQRAEPVGQRSPGRISGKIYDRTGAVIPGVSVELRNTTGTLVGVSVSDGTGIYGFSAADSGQYTLQARLPGFTTYQRAMTVRDAEALTQDIVLQLAPIRTVVAVTANKPAQTAAPNLPTRIGGVVAAPNLVFQPKPVYPPLARAALVQGEVVLQAVIGIDGTIVSVQLDPSQGSTNLDLINAAMESVKQWRYRPALLNGMPIEFATTISVNFSLID